MKTRIVQQGQYFYVQYKRTWFWRDHMNPYGSEPQRYLSLDQARDSAKRIELQLMAEEAPTIIHETHEHGR